MSENGALGEYGRLGFTIPIYTTHVMGFLGLRLEYLPV